MVLEHAFRRYQELQQYVGWNDEAARLVAAAGPLVEPHLPALVDDFYAVIQQFPDAVKVITGGPEQIHRLKGTLLGWVRELFRGPYDESYAGRRWRVGLRHVEIGLDQVYTNAALSRLRTGLVRAVQESWAGDDSMRGPTVRAVNTLLDLDLALIEDAYQSEFTARQQRSERLAAIGRVAGGIAHELRNPLNVIKTSIYYLLNARNPTPEKKAEHLGRIERQVTLADDVITALSNFARLPGPNLRPFDLAACFREALEMSAVPEAVQLTIDCPPDLPAALGDADQLRIVLGNLARNACEAMHGSGQLTFVARADGPHVRASVGDTGSGIAADQLARIMEPLYSTKARGLGLGLAIARAILEKNNGTLEAASTPGQGSTFTVTLLAASAEGGTS